MRHGLQIDPPNRFQKFHSIPDEEHLEWDTEYQDSRGDRPIQHLADASKSIVSESASAEISFRLSVDPCRGCQNGSRSCAVADEFSGTGARV